MLIVIRKTDPRFAIRDKRTMNMVRNEMVGEYNLSKHSRQQPLMAALRTALTS